MEYAKSRVDRYRQQAEEARQRALGSPNQRMRQAWLKIADEYEMLVKLSEKWEPRGV